MHVNWSCGGHVQFLQGPGGSHVPLCAGHVPLCGSHVPLCGSGGQ